MPSKDQDLFDMSWVLDSLDTFSENIEAHFESVARSLQDTFRQTPWLPDVMKPPAPPPSRSVPILKAPLGYYELSRDWISEHRAVSAAVVAFVGTGVFIVWRRRRSDRAKRRAKRAKNGARTEVIVLAGSPHSPLTKSLSLDLERRGFIVYIPVSTLSEEQVVHSMSRTDIRSLSLDITSPDSTEETIQKLHNLLTTPHHAIPNTTPHTLHLAALVHLASSNHTPNLVISLSPSNWSDALNTHLLAPFTTISAFLPLLASQQSTLLFLTPSVAYSLAPPFQATENVVAGGMEQYISTLRKEAQSQGINIAQIKLGHFDLGGGEKQQQQQQQIVNFHGPSPSRAELTKQRLLQQDSNRGTALRQLHNSVFDAIERGVGRSSIVFIGRGSRTYDLVGRFVPEGLVGWMMGQAGSGREPVSEGKRARTPERFVRRGSGEENGGSVQWEKVERA